MHYRLLAASITAICISSCSPTPPKEVKKIPTAADSACDRGTKEAEEDFKLGRLMLYETRMPSRKLTNYWDLLEKEYGVGYKMGICCAPLPDVECYNVFMKAKIEEKFGAGFLEKVERRSDSIDRMKK